MLKKLITTIATVSVAFSANLFAAATDTMVSPSAINLEADGVSIVTIHTPLKNLECTQDSFSVYLKVVPEDPDPDDYPLGYFDIMFEYGDLGFTVDRLGHMVIRIVAWDVARQEENIPTGDAIFTVIGDCTGEDGVSDEAIIIAK
jgi:hypothetical protein